MLGLRGPHGLVLGQRSLPLTAALYQSLSDVFGLTRMNRHPAGQSYDD